LNLVVVFTLCGLWHGAGYNFLIWGLYHGCLLVIERVADRQFGLKPRGVLGVTLTIFFVMIGWVFFRIEHFGSAIVFLQTLFGFGTASTFFFPPLYFLTPDVTLYLVAGIVFALVPAEKLRWKLDEQRLLVFAVQLTGSFLIFCLAAVQLAANSFNPFIYFRF
jgi:alginate O-acetyltransferase complex protein AlgI